MAYVYFGAITAVVTAVSVTGIAAALRMRPGRRWTPVVVIILEGLWVALSFGSAATDSGGPPPGQYYVGGILAVTAIIGLLMPPTRAYCGLTG